MKLNKSVFRKTCSVLLFALTAQFTHAGFLEMPDTTEVPEYEKDSMLLDMDIPAVRDRDPDPEAGPRLNVKEFRLQGLVEYPDLGITRKELIKKVEAIRFDFMKEGEKTESGYTISELGEISDLVAQIEKETEGTHVGPLEVQKLVFLIRDQRRRRGITLGMIETVADTITRYYRERGFILAKAYIPKQQVRDGVVTLTLLLGDLGDVNVVNNKRVSENKIKAIFKDDMFKPVTSWSVEENLYLVNDIPGLTAQGFFQPGDQVGDTKLNVNVLSEKWYSSNLRMDNHGSDTTGKYRMYGDFYLHNPLGYGDELLLGALYTVEPDNTTYGTFRYSFPFISSRLTTSVGVSSNDFIFQPSSSGQAAFDNSVAGKSFVADINFNYKLKRSRKSNYSIDFNYSDIDTKLVQSDLSNDTKAKNFTLGFNFDLITEKKRNLHVGNFSLIQSSTENLDERQGELLTDSSVYVRFDYSRLSFLEIPFTDTISRLVLKSSGQYAGKSVGSINQMALAGPSKARGYDVSTGFFDDALYFGADWFVPLFGKKLSKTIQPYLFTDLAYGSLNPIDGSDDEASVEGTFADVGIGFNVTYKDIKSNITLAAALSDDIGLEEEVSGSAVYFDLQYAF